MKLPWTSRVADQSPIPVPDDLPGKLLGAVVSKLKESDGVSRYSQKFSDHAANLVGTDNGLRLSAVRLDGTDAPRGFLQGALPYRLEIAHPGHMRMEGPNPQERELIGQFARESLGLREVEGKPGKVTYHGHFATLGGMIEKVRQAVGRDRAEEFLGGGPTDGIRR